MHQSLVGQTRLTFPKVIHLPSLITEGSEQAETISLSLQCELLEWLLCSEVRDVCANPVKGAALGRCSACFHYGNPGSVIDCLIFGENSRIDVMSA